MYVLLENASPGSGKLESGLSRFEGKWKLECAGVHSISWPERKHQELPSQQSKPLLIAFDVIPSLF
jgi:hypothetical protein